MRFTTLVVVVLAREIKLRATAVAMAVLAAVALVVEMMLQHLVPTVWAVEVAAAH